MSGQRAWPRKVLLSGSTDSYKVRQQSRITQELGGDCSLKGVEFCPLPPGTEGARSHFSVVTDSVAVTPWNQVTGREREEVGRGGEKKKGGALIHSFVHSFLPPLTSFSKYILPFRGWGHKREHDP